MTLRNFWQRITTTRYTWALEAELSHVRSENALLRAENRALLNSILGIAGVPPIQVDHESLAPAEPTTRAAAPQNRAPKSTRSPASHPGSPMRRRSWQQINRMLEFESARKAVSSDR